MEHQTREAIKSFFTRRNLFEDESMGAGAEISIWRLLLALIPPLAVSIISYRLNLKITRKILISIFRTIVQLLLAGYVLLSFIFNMRSPFVVMGYLILMIFIAALEATARQVRTYPGHFWHSTLAILASGGVMGLYGSVVVYHPTPWWEPHVVVPTAGMIIGNAISGPALAVDRLLADVAEKRHESETRLAFGASRSESVLPVLRSAILAALLPNLNQMSVVGLVSIPGMMTGQLLAGASPLVAAEYQMSILWLIFATAAVSTYIGVSLAISQGVFDSDHRLTQGRVVKRGKFSCEAYIYVAVKDALYGVCGTLQRAVRAMAPSRRGTVDADGGIDYELVRAQSTHGLAPRLQGLSEKPSSSAETSPLDEESIDTLGSPSPPGSPASAPTGKVTFTFFDNQPQAHAEADLSLAGGVLFEASGLNVMSGEEPLFATSGDQSGVNITLRRGERMSVEGPSGLGKTRLLRALAQLDSPLCGTMHIASRGEGINTSAGSSGVGGGSGSSSELANSAMSIGFTSSYLGMGGLVPRWRCRVTYVPQAVPPLAGSPRDLVAEACAYASRQGWDLSCEILTSLDRQCAHVEGQLGLPEGTLGEAWSTLSGGQRQRAAIACALVLAGTYCACYGSSDESDDDDEDEEKEKNRPLRSSTRPNPPRGDQDRDRDRVRPASVLLLDEPTAACDAVTALMVERAVVRSGLAVVWITHDPRQAERMAHKRLILTSLKDLDGRSNAPGSRRGGDYKAYSDCKVQTSAVDSSLPVSATQHPTQEVPSVTPRSDPDPLATRLSPLLEPQHLSLPANPASTGTSPGTSASSRTSPHSPPNFPITIISGTITSPIPHTLNIALSRRDSAPPAITSSHTSALALSHSDGTASLAVTATTTCDEAEGSTVISTVVSTTVSPLASTERGANSDNSDPALDPALATNLNPPRSPQPVSSGSLSTTPAPTLSHSAWAAADALAFQVRSATYLTDAVKCPSPLALLQLVAVDLFTTPPNTLNIAAHPRNRVQLARQRGDPAWVFVLHIVIPGPPHLSFVAYFQGDPAQIDDDTPFGRLARPFFRGKSDQFRDNRFKLIPRVVDGNMIVKMAIKDTPTLLGTKLKQHYFRGDNYFELAVDVGSSTVAKNIVGMAIGYSKSLVVDLGFCLQGERAEELPEVLLGAVSCVRIDCSRAKKL